MRERIRLGIPIFLASLNMRAGLVLVGPIIPILKSYYGLSNTAVSILAGIPIACFAGSSILMKSVARLGSSNRIIKWALTALTIALIARAFTGLIGLFLFTFLMGISIAVMNFEIPAWVKSHAQSETGLFTGIYVTLMGVFGSIAVAISVPLAELNSLSWRMAMIPWMFVALFTALYWWSKESNKDTRQNTEQNYFWKSKAFRNPIAWCLALYFGTESLTFYATATWFPTILTTKDFTLREAAVAVSLSGVIGSMIGLAAPHYISKVSDQRLIIALVTIATGFSFFMISVQSGHVLFIWLTLSNIGISIAFPIALMLSGTKSASPEATRNLSTMFQSIGYVVSSMGPLFLGSLYDLTGSWDKAMLGIVAFTFLQLIFGLIVGKPNQVDY